MGARRGLPVAIAGLLTALWLAGCAGSLNSGHPVNGSEQLGGVQQTPSQTGAGPTSLSPPGVTQVAQVSGGAQATAGAYRIGPADMLDITVFKVPELSKTIAGLRNRNHQPPSGRRGTSSRKDHAGAREGSHRQARSNLPAKPASLGVGQRE